MSTNSENTEKPKFIPPKRSFAVEFWVGLFAIVGVGAFGFTAINIANIRLSDAGYYELKAEFGSVSGLKLGAPVEIAGVEIGTIRSIVLNDTQALVTMRIQDSVKIRDDDIAAIRTKGIIGDRYIKVVPGGSSEYLKQGARLSETESAVEFEEIIGKFIHQLDS